MIDIYCDDFFVTTVIGDGRYIFCNSYFIFPKQSLSAKINLNCSKFQNVSCVNTYVPVKIYVCADFVHDNYVR